MCRALNETVVDGISTNLPFQRAVINDEQFNRGSYTTHFIDERKIMYKLEAPVQDNTGFRGSSGNHWPLRQRTLQSVTIL